MRLTGLHGLAVVAAFALPAACANAPAEPSNNRAGVAPAANDSILQSSIPAAGSTVQRPVNELMLHFNRPARLDEVTVTGPEGTMPMMITAVDEVQHYSLPLSALGPGAYTVAWRATAKGQAYQGSFGLRFASQRH